jgi:hypothetical protein
MVTLAGDGRAHVAVSQRLRLRPGRPRLLALRVGAQALNSQCSTFADRHLFIQSFDLQGGPSLDLA